MLTCYDVEPVSLVCLCSSAQAVLPQLSFLQALISCSVLWGLAVLFHHICDLGVQQSCDYTRPIIPCVFLLSNLAWREGNEVSRRPGFYCYFTPPRELNPRDLSSALMTAQDEIKVFSVFTVAVDC